MTEATQVDVRDNPARGRFEAFVNGVEAGIADYQLEPGVIAFTHTFVRPEYRGGRVALDLATTALEEARARGLRVVPACSFFRRFIQSHAQYQDLVAGRS